MTNAVTTRTSPTASSVEGVWSALESSRGLLSVPACWRERLGENYEPFRKAFLSQSSQLPTVYPCPRHCGCMHEIIRNQPATEPQDKATSSQTSHPPFVAVCCCPEPHCPDIVVPAEEAVLVELSWTKLARALCAVLNLDYKPVELGLLNTRQIGSWPATNTPVIFTIQTDHAWFRSVLLELSARLRSGFILLAPTALHFDAVCQELLSHDGAIFCPLEGNLRLSEDGILQTAKLPGELLAAVTTEPDANSDAQVAQRAFALVQQLENESKRQVPAPLTVFRLFCVQGWGTMRIARHMGCSRATILRRLKLIEDRIGMSAARLRGYSSHLERLNDQSGAGRARPRRTVQDD